MINDDIMVSVDLIAHNHELYIGQALESILKQRTNFKFEILVCDDASTDGTAEIIRRYAALYPDEIKPVYLTDNMFQKGVKVSDCFLYPHIRGKYVAFCEGDDYWSDENKLQLQVDYLESYPECTFCVHSVSFISAKNELLRVAALADCDMSFDIDYFAKNINNFQATSVIVPTRVIKCLPKYYYDFFAPDTPLALHALSMGSGFYINKNMSVFRNNIPGSWLEYYHGLSSIKCAVYNIEEADLFCDVNRLTGYKYNNALQAVECEKISRALDEILSGSVRLPVKRRLKYILMLFSPRLLRLIMQCKNIFSRIFRCA